MATGNLVNLEKTAEMSPVKDELLASYSKQNFFTFLAEKWKISSIKLSIKSPFLFIFVNSSQILS